MEEIIARVEEKFEEAAAAYPEFAGKALILAALRADGQVGLFAEQDGRVCFFTKLSFELPDELIGLFGDSSCANISAEQIDLLDSGDVVAWMQVLYAGGAGAILQHPSYSTLARRTGGPALPARRPGGRGLLVQQRVQPAVRASMRAFRTLRPHSRLIPRRTSITTPPRPFLSRNLMRRRFLASTSTAPSAGEGTPGRSACPVCSSVVS